MTPTVKTLEMATAERDRLAAEARAAGEIADKLAAERWEVLADRRRTFAAGVLADHAAVAAELAKAERDARAAFGRAAVDGDARLAYLDWIDARNQVNVHRDRVGAARAAIGEVEADAAYLFKDVPDFSTELSRALVAEASNRFADRREALQLELNALEQL